MANLRQYKKKIKSAKNIAKITKAMQMVAASKMKRAQDLAKASRDYSDGISEFSSSITRSISFAEPIHPLLSRVSQDVLTKELVVYIAPERGLCGGLISGLYRYVEATIGEGNLKKHSFVVIGKRARTHVNRFGGNISAEFSTGISQPVYDSIPAIARFIREEFLGGRISKVICFYSRFINTLEQEPISKILLPLDLVDVEKRASEKEAATEFRLFEPGPAEIASALLDRYLEVELYQLTLEAYASEQSARMIAMKNATDNAKGLIDELTMGYNKERQTRITSEISDISSTLFTQS